MVAILYHKKNPEDYISAFYSIETYAKVYEHVINPMPGPDKWPNTPWGDIFPPKVKNQPGRPKKRRRRDPNTEPTTDLPQYRISREGNRLKCGNCREVGHNSLKCTKPRNPNYVKRVKKKTTSNNQDASNMKKRGRKPKNAANEPTSQPSQIYGSVMRFSAVWLICS
ncbi:hypothetical protein LUZ60_005903 [Juncus effusus]|nr:hypothetical protein LUZ60_005903 [Juncus effusus]